MEWKVDIRFTSTAERQAEGNPGSFMEAIDAKTEGATWRVLD